MWSKNHIDSSTEIEAQNSSKGYVTIGADIGMPLLYLNSHIPIYFIQPSITRDNIYIICPPESDNNFVPLST